MSLRVRLIVAFFLLSVVPLGAVTLFAYWNNAKALRTAAQSEAESLAGDLSQRMQLVTTQLSERVEYLMDLSAANQAAQAAQDAAAAAPTAAAIAAPAPPPGAAQPATVMDADEVGKALGEVAMLFTNIELRGLRGPGGGGRQGPPGQGRGGREGLGGREGFPPPDGSRGQRGGDGPPPPPAGSTATPPGAGGRASDPRFRDDTTRVGPADRRGPRPEPGSSQPPGPPNAPGPIVTSGEDRLRIDLMPLRTEMLREMVPDGKWESLTPDERQRVISQVNQRLLGIAQGIKMSAAELQKIAEAQKLAEAQKVAADAQSAAAAGSASKSRNAAHATPKVAPAPPVPPVASLTPPTSPPVSKPTATVPGPAPAPPPAAAAPAPAVATKPGTAPAASTTKPAAPLQRKTAITGSRMDVTVERNGQVVRQLNAEIDLPNFLSTVFSTTRRERGEVPFAVGKDGRIYTPTAADRATVESLGAVTKPETAAGTTMLPEWIVVTTTDPTGSGLKFGIARPVGDSLNALRRTSARNAGLGLAVICLALIGIVPLSSRLTRNLSVLSEGVRRIAAGDYRARVQVKANDEIGALAKAFNSMAADVEKHQRSAVEQERIKRELELGRQIQHDMLPQAPFKLGLTEIKGVSVPAREVGGDFFNYFQVANGEIALLVGDVSGKGVGAALLMANIQAALRTRLAMGQDLASLAHALDDDIESSTPGPVYATLFVGILNPVSRVIRYVNAGHHSQYVLRKQGGLDRMPSTGLPIGLFAGRGYTEQQMQLAAGDLLFFYTDGCVEADNETGDMFGAERLEEVLLSSAAAGADDILARVEQAVSTFRGKQEPFDDATMMAVNVG